MLTTFDRQMLAQADKVAKTSTCSRKAIGAVFVDAERTVTIPATNTAPPGLPTCEDKGCLVSNAHCWRTVHAEVRAILAAVATGIQVRRGTIYLNYAPCVACANILVTAGIARVVCRRVGVSIQPERNGISILETGGIKVACEHNAYA